MNIYVGNLSFNVIEADLKDLFSQHGAVQTASVIKDKYSGESRGFGFVEMPEKEEALKAISARADVPRGGLRPLLFRGQRS